LAEKKLTYHPYRETTTDDETWRFKVEAAVRIFRTQLGMRPKCVPLTPKTAKYYRRNS